MISQHNIILFNMKIVQFVKAYDFHLEIEDTCGLNLEKTVFQKIQFDLNTFLYIKID